MGCRIDDLCQGRCDPDRVSPISPDHTMVGVEACLVAFIGGRVEALSKTLKDNCSCESLVAAGLFSGP